jgi:hypothetical protein
VRPVDSRPKLIPAAFFAEAEARGRRLISKSIKQFAEKLSR